MFGLTGFEEQQAIRICAKTDQLEMGDDALFEENTSYNESDQLESMAFSAYGEIEQWK